MERQATRESCDVLLGHSLQQALVDLDAAYKNFWAGRAGPPKPRKRGRDDSFRFPDPAQVCLSGNLRVPDKRRTRSIKHATLTLPKLGAGRCVLHRAIPEGATLLSVIALLALRRLATESQILRTTRAHRPYRRSCSSHSEQCMSAANTLIIPINRVSRKLARTGT